MENAASMFGRGATAKHKRGIWELREKIRGLTVERHLSERTLRKFPVAHRIERYMASIDPDFQKKLSVVSRPQ